MNFLGVLHRIAESAGAPLTQPSPQEGRGRSRPLNLPFSPRGEGGMNEVYSSIPRGGLLEKKRQSRLTRSIAMASLLVVSSGFVDCTIIPRSVTLHVQWTRQSD